MKTNDNFNLVFNLFSTSNIPFLIKYGFESFHRYIQQIFADHNPNTSQRSLISSCSICFLPWCFGIRIFSANLSWRRITALGPVCTSLPAAYWVFFLVRFNPFVSICMGIKMIITYDGERWNFCALLDGLLTNWRFMQEFAHAQLIPLMLQLCICY